MGQGLMMTSEELVAKQWADKQAAIEANLQAKERAEAQAKEKQSAAKREFVTYVTDGHIGVVKLLAYTQVAELVVKELFNSTKSIKRSYVYDGIRVTPELYAAYAPAVFTLRLNVLAQESIKYNNDIPEILELSNTLLDLIKQKIDTTAEIQVINLIKTHLRSLLLSANETLTTKIQVPSEVELFDLRQCMQSIQDQLASVQGELASEFISKNQTYQGMNGHLHTLPLSRTQARFCLLAKGLGKLSELFDPKFFMAVTVITAVLGLFLAVGSRYTSGVLTALSIVGYIAAAAVAGIALGSALSYGSKKLTQKYDLNHGKEPVKLVTAFAPTSLLSYQYKNLGSVLHTPYERRGEHPVDKEAVRLKGLS